jgi:uncharacterized damage-inducible protein DinB
LEQTVAMQFDYDAWFKAKVIEAVNDTEFDREHEDVKRDFVAKRQALINHE